MLYYTHTYKKDLLLRSEGLALLAGHPSLLCQIRLVAY